MGATDVCPLIPVANISMEETADWARKLGRRVGEELGLPVYLYEAAASTPERKNLATIRSGEYEGLSAKLKDPKWKPDFGPATFIPEYGATVIGARDFLIAYNANLNTTSVRRANSVAFDIREQGRVKRKGNPITGSIERDESGEAVRIPGSRKSVKAIGWFIEEYGTAQVSMNLTNLADTSLHEAFEACRDSANARGMRVTGSELVGLIPLKVMLDAGRFYLHRQERSTAIPDSEIIQIAVKSLGLDELTPFDPKKKIIEYLLEDSQASPLVQKTLTDFAAVTASESPTPGGGSASAYVGALGASLGIKVANRSAHKRGWETQWKNFSNWGDKGKALQTELLTLVDADTNAFNQLMEAFRMDKNTDEEIAIRTQAIQTATTTAIEVPLRVMHAAAQTFALLEAMILEGNVNSVTDAGVGVLCTRTAIRGAGYNVLVNLSGLKDKTACDRYRTEAEQIMSDAEATENKLLALVQERLAKM
jgi:glutamate formiminotransferase/formiminotetrahydrofolate cyclodeaminase